MVHRYRHLTVSSGSGKPHPAVGCFLLASISTSVSFNQPLVRDNRGRNNGRSSVNFRAF